MRFLVDNALSYRVANLLQEAGHDAVHVLSLGLSDAADQVIFKRAQDDDRIIISADTDFGTLLALWDANKPSVILIRWAGLRKAEDQVKVLLANLSNLQNDLETGAIVVIEPALVRVRSLPINPKQVH